MATHSSILAWEIPLTEEPGGLQSRVGLASQEPDRTQGLNNNFKTSIGLEEISPDAPRRPTVAGREGGTREGRSRACAIVSERSSLNPAPFFDWFSHCTCAVRDCLFLCRRYQ